MTKTNRNTAAAAEDSFHKHYSAIWGAERWQNSLYPALAKPTRYAAMVNRYVSIEDFWKAIDEAQIPRDDLQKLTLPNIGSRRAADGTQCFARASASGAPFPPPKAGSSGLQTHWNLDVASAVVAQLLDVQPGERVLDLCAAPGGKSVALAQSLFPELYADNLDTPTPSHGLLRSNEADGRRQKRLSENLAAYLPKQANVQCLRIDGASGTAGGLFVPSGYDKILVDAPCSSERHIIHAQLKAKASGNTAPEMANWRPGSSKRLAQTQLALLMMALKTAKVGGTVMYATCSLETTENDSVIEKMLAQVEKERKKGVKWRVELGLEASEQLEVWAEKTKYGWIVLPDRGGGWGPLFSCSLTKVSAS